MFVPLTLALLVLPGSSSFAGAADSKDKTSTKIVVTLHFPGETKNAEVLKVVEKLKSLKDVELLLRVPEEGKGVCADVSTSEPVSAKAMGEVVEVLLRVGIRKLSIEVKKA